MTDAIAGPAGPYLAILAMTAATYACRTSGALLMSRVRLTPRVERALGALPGSIIVATVLPIAVRSGPAAFVGLFAALAAMRVLRHDLAALLSGLAAVILARAVGLS
jgi:uncharacterized membrane protein